MDVHKTFGTDLELEHCHLAVGQEESNGSATVAIVPEGWPCIKLNMLQLVSGWMSLTLTPSFLRGRPSHFPRRCNQINSYVSLREEKDIHVFSFWLVIHQSNANALNRLLEKTSVSLACRQISLRLFLPLLACFPLQLGASAFIKPLVDPALRTVSAGQRHLLKKWPKLALCESFHLATNISIFRHCLFEFNVTLYHSIALETLYNFGF
jgi:hypothetical protein